MHSLVVGLNAVVVAVTDEVPQVLTLRPRERSAKGESLPFGLFDPSRDRTLELALRRCLREQSGVDLGYVEQLYTFGDRNRDPSESAGGPRVVSVAYLALGRQLEPLLSRAHWREWYAFFPWEDWRDGRPGVIERRIEPALKNWVESLGARKRRERVERIDIAFGLGGAPWDTERVLERYELLYEAGSIREACRDRNPVRSSPSAAEVLGLALALDHRRILSAALGRLRGKLKYRPVVFELVPPVFTLFQLQRVVEALAGVRLHKQNFRRLVEKGGLVERTGQLQSETGGRPAELFRFRREVLRERPAPGVGLPGLRI